MSLLQQVEPTFKSLFFGELSIEEWKYQIFLLFIGVLLRIFIRIKDREDQKVDLSLLYWVKSLKNWSSIFFSIIMMYLLIRFYGEYKDSALSFLPEKFNASMYFMMVCLGFYLHKISIWLSKLIAKE